MSDASYTIEVSGQSVIYSIIQSIIEAPTDTRVICLCCTSLTRSRIV